MSVPRPAQTRALAPQEADQENRTFARPAARKRASLINAAAGAAAAALAVQQPLTMRAVLKRKAGDADLSLLASAAPAAAAKRARETSRAPQRHPLLEITPRVAATPLEPASVGAAHRQAAREPASKAKGLVSKPAKTLPDRARFTTSYPSPSSSFASSGNATASSASLLTDASTAAEPEKPQKAQAESPWAEYETEWVAHLRNQEPLYSPSGLEIVRLQTEVEWKHRARLVNWLVRLQMQYRDRISARTVHLAVNLLDRFLAHTFVSLSRFHLAGVAALLIASKSEDRAPLSVSTLSRATHNTVPREWIVAAETAVLGALQWRVTLPQPSDFVVWLGRPDRALLAPPLHPCAAENLALFVAEAVLAEERLLECPSSLRAAAAYYLALETLGQLPLGAAAPPKWSQRHTKRAEYARAIVHEVAMVCLESLAERHVPLPSTGALRRARSADAPRVALDTPGGVWVKYADAEHFPCVRSLGPSKVMERVLRFNRYIS